MGYVSGDLPFGGPSSQNIQGSAQFANPLANSNPITNISNAVSKYFAPANSPAKAAGAVQGAQTQNTPPPASTGPGDSQLVQLQKAAQSGGLNPSQQTLYNQLLAQQNQQPQGVSQDDINAAYDPVYGTINNLYSSAQNNKQTYLDAATSPYDALRPGIDQAKTEGLNLNQQQVDQTNQGQANALSAARQLYNELTQGVQQRFGGIGSTADFAKAFFGRQLQQNEGGIYNTVGQNMRALYTQAANIVSQFNNNVKELESKKAAALSQAQVQFQQRLDQIDQLRLQTDQQKAHEKLSALQELKATANAIQSQFTQFQEQLHLQQQSAADQLRNSVATAQAYSHQPINLSAIPGAQYSQIGTPQAGGNSAFGVTGQMGQIDPRTNRPLG